MIFCNCERLGTKTFWLFGSVFFCGGVLLFFFIKLLVVKKCREKAPRSIGLRTGARENRPRFHIVLSEINSGWYDIYGLITYLYYALKHRGWCVLQRWRARFERWCVSTSIHNKALTWKRMELYSQGVFAAYRLCFHRERVFFQGLGGF